MHLYEFRSNIFISPLCPPKAKYPLDNSSKDTTSESTLIVLIQCLPSNSQTLIIISPEPESNKFSFSTNSNDVILSVCPFKNGINFKQSL
jgi:hypothetical protein